MLNLTNKFGRSKFEGLDSYFKNQYNKANKLPLISVVRLVKATQ